MDNSEMSQIFWDHLTQYRCWSYERLVACIDRGRLGHSCAISADGTPYQLSFDVVWDDQPGGNVRVLGDLCAEPQLRRMVDDVWNYRPNVANDFIMGPDGNLVGEERRIN